MTELYTTKWGRAPKWKQQTRGNLHIFFVEANVGRKTDECYNHFYRLFDIYFDDQDKFFLPVDWAVYWKRNVKLGIAVHISLNLLGGLLTMALILGQK